MSKKTATVLIVGLEDGRETDFTCATIEKVLSKLTTLSISIQVIYYLQPACLPAEQWTQSCMLIILLNDAPSRTSWHAEFFQLAIDTCTQQRKRMVHVMKNFKGSDDKFASYMMSRRARQMLTFHDLETTALDQVVSSIQNHDTDSFFSPGESFAWQLVTGFLSYIAPDLRHHIQSHLLDDRGSSVRAEILQEFGLTDLDPKRILVLPKYFLLLNEQLVCSQQSVAICPQELFPGCNRISNASSDLCLEFDSPVYKKSTPAYLMELEKPITKDQSTYSHVMIFCGYAAPTFIIQKLDLSSDKKLLMFRQFTDELKFILNHPKSSRLLRDSNECSSAEVSGDESRAVELVDVTDMSSLRCRIIEETKSHLLTQDWCLVSKNLLQTGESVSLMVKFSISMMSEVMENVGQSLSRHGFRVEDFPQVATDAAGQFERCLFVVHLSDLQKMRDEQERAEFDDARHNYLMRDIASAVSNMHRCGKHNISMVIVKGTVQQDARVTLSCLPESLRHLPDCCVASVSDLTHLHNLEFSTCGGSKRSGSFSEVISLMDLHSEGITTEDSLPLMSMAYAMAANAWIGFGQLLLSHCLQVTSDGHQLPFDLPYCFVIPKSGRYPDEAKLHKHFEEIGVSSRLEEFRVPSGRRYSFRVHQWKSLRLAFEIPSSVLSIRKQAECGVGGIAIRSGQLGVHLAEFRDALQSFVSGSGGRFRVIEWDDVTNFDEDAWMEPSEELAVSLLDRLASVLVYSD